LASSHDGEIARLQARIRDLEGALGYGAVNPGGTFHLPPQRARLLGLLMSVPHVTHHMVEQQLEIGSHAKVVMHRLRGDLNNYTRAGALPPLVIQGKRSVGYWFDAETKARIKALLTSKVTAASTAPEAEPAEAIMGDAA
jgi:hypothetical protein